MKDTGLSIVVDMFNSATGISQRRNLSSAEYFDEKTLCSGADAIFGMSRKWNIYDFFQEFEDFDVFKITILDISYELTYVQKITYWNGRQSKLHQCYLFKGNEENLTERQMILTQSIEGGNYLVNRFKWLGDTWFPESEFFGKEVQG